MCPDDATLDANLMQVFRMAPRDLFYSGRKWYRRENRQCRDLARKYDRPLHVVAAMASVLSPSVSWDDIILGVEALLQNPDAVYQKNRLGNTVLILGYGKNVHKARHMSRTGDVSVMHGPKVWRFFGCLMLLIDEAVIDIHATQAALLSCVNNGPGANYHRIADAYARCAQRVNLSVPDFQAIVWVVWKSVKRGYK
jgi:hypothetical protein